MANRLLIFALLVAISCWTEYHAGFVTIDHFKGAVIACGFQAPTEDQYVNFDRFAESQGQISSIEEAAMALTNIIKDSYGLLQKREWRCQQPVTLNCPDDYRTAGCDIPDQFYYAQGYIMLKGCESMQTLRSAFKRLVDSPDDVASDEELAWKTAFWYWRAYVHDYPGVQKGKFGATINPINPAECTVPGDPTATTRKECYRQVRMVFGLGGPGDTSGCP